VSATHHEQHVTARSNWLRAAVMGANDGIVSTAALVVGVAAASTTRDPVVVAAVAGLIAGAASMAVGEYVSVAAAKDAQEADLRVNNASSRPTRRASCSNWPGSTRHEASATRRRSPSRPS
jgi:VIT1/CCC1 family predicted Fe2+/Mn2+ transporter